MELKKNEFTGKNAKVYKTYKLAKNEGLGMNKKAVVIARFADVPFDNPRFKHLVGNAKASGKPYDFWSISAIMEGGNLDEVMPQYMESDFGTPQVSLDLGSFEKVLPQDVDYKGKNYAFFMEPWKHREGKVAWSFQATEIASPTDAQVDLLTQIRESGQDPEEAYLSTYMDKRGDNQVEVSMKETLKGLYYLLLVDEDNFNQIVSMGGGD